MGKASFFNELTGIRAIAAFMVFMHHYNYFTEPMVGSFMHNFINEFHIGVPIFFVLSGFLICYRYYDNIKLHDNRWTVQYIQNRVARIYPMYFLVTTGTFLLIILKFQQWPHSTMIYLANITFVKGFCDSLKFTGVGQGWTLTVEECFYFTAPVIFLLSRKPPASRRPISPTGRKRNPRSAPAGTFS